MKKLIIPYILFILVAIPIVSSDSSVTVENTIDESLYVTFNFTNIEPQLYNETKTQGFNISTVPNAIEEKLKQQNLTDASVIYDFNQKIFNDNTSSIFLKLLLTGPDIISYTLNETDMTRTFQVRTDWRKTEISFTQNFSLNLEEHFGAPLVAWQQVNYTMANGKIHPAFERNVEDPFEMLFQFILPENAFDIQTEEDTIIFKVPPAFEDRLLNSPFLILGAIIIANIIFVAYRKARK